VFYRGKETRIKIGGTKVIKALRGKNKEILVLTNNSTDSVETIHRRLSQFEILVEREEILTSSLLTAEYLQLKVGKIKYFLVGEKGLEEELEKFGHERVWDAKAEFVVVGLDRKVTYEKIDTASRLVRNGAGLIATHNARLYMYRNGPAIATGPFVKAIEYGGGKKAVVIGKPSPLMFRAALRRGGVRKDQAVMIGDQVDTDILGASKAGIDSILVKTGVDKDSGGVPTLADLANVDEIVGLL